MATIGSMTVSPFITTITNSLLFGGLALLPTILYQFARLDEIRDRFQSRGSYNPDNIYDFIVVGAGTSGCVVANRLSEKYKVLLLEAGGEPFPLMNIPAMASLFPNQQSYDWSYRTVPQLKSCFSLKNQESLWVRGKALGGTSNLNFMAYIRGHPLDYDHWAYLTGDDRWSYENFLYYLKKSENFDAYGSSGGPYHGVGGELNIESKAERPLAPYFLKAAEELGYKVVDLNKPFDEGFGNFSYTSKNGHRLTTYSAFLEGIKDSRGGRLTIFKYATVIKVLMKGSNNFAYGVEYERHGVIRTAKAKKEVILSAGTIESPKILMQSGIGPAQHLRSIGIHPRLDRPVGQNLQDHIIAFVGPFTVKEHLTFVLDRDSKIANLVDYFQRGTGPLTSTGIEASGLILSNYAKSIHDPNETMIWPDIQLILVGSPLPKDGPKILSNLFNLKEEVSEEYYRPVAGNDSFHIMAVVSRPKSRGQIRLTSKDYKKKPLIDPNYLNDPYDADIIMEGVQMALRLVEDTKAFKQIGATLSPTPFPKCKGMEYRSEAYWRCYLEEYTLSVYHPVGTCAMGKVNDSNAVVDTRLKVIGTPNLRVIDASIQPQIISSNIQSACIAIGEIGSDFIKETWDKKYRPKYTGSTH